MDKVFYKILETTTLFPGLTNEAIDFLKDNGDWFKLIDIREYNYKGDLGLLFVSNDESSVDNFNLIGIIVEDKVLPTVVYSTIDLGDAILPLFKYKIGETEFLYEIQDIRQSSIYPELKTLALKTEDGTILFEWGQEELEIAELILEHNMGY